jgi:hypothetical protein
MCSSRNRPKELIRMLESFDTTRTIDSEVVVYISDDDPRLSEYRDALKDRRWIYEIGSHKYMVDVLNYFSTKIYPDCEYYQEVNDDHIYQTVGWDRMLTDVIENSGYGWGMSFPNNTINKNPSATMISGNIVRSLGWYALPTLRHSSTDCSTAQIGNALKRLYYVGEAIIEHRCWHDTVHGIGVRAPEDDNVKFVYSPEEEEFGRQKCMAHDFGRDIAMINDAIRRDGKAVFQ